MRISEIESEIHNLPPGYWKKLFLFFAAMLVITVAFALTVIFLA